VKMTGNNLRPGDIYVEKQIRGDDLVEEVDEGPNGNYNRRVECPVCEEEMWFYGNDDLLMDCHRDCLTDEEEELLDQERAKREREWDAIEASEKAKKQARTLAGDLGENGLPPELPKESAMAGLGERDEEGE